MLRIQSVIILVIEFMSEGDDECVSDLWKVSKMSIFLSVYSCSGASTHSFTCSVTMRLIREKLLMPQTLRQASMTILRPTAITLINRLVS